MTAQPTTTPAAVIAAAHDFGEREAVADGDVRLTFTQLHDRVRDFAAALCARGVQPGEHVAIWSPNTFHWVIAALGVHYAGATLVPINTRYTATEALDIVERTKSAALVVAGMFLGTDRYATLRDESSTLDLPTVVRVPVDGGDLERPGVLDFDDFLALATDDTRAAADRRARAVDAEDIADVMFTSGTTGRSKGVLSAHRQVVGIARAWADCAEVTADDNYLVINPFFHTFGYKAGMLVCLLTGATVVPMAVFDVPKVMATVHDEHITVLPGAPTIFQSILDHPDRSRYDLSSLRIAVTGAAAVPVALVERMQSELSFEAVLTAYGQTEAVVITMCRTDDDPVTVSTTSGRAIPGMEVRIGERGEILVRGENVMLGYLDDPEATARTIEPDGWLHTGDVGVLDERGYLDITDRLKDMYISGGFNVYPAEVENALARLDGVAESAVIGVPDERMGEVGRAYVVTKPGTSLTEDDVIAFGKKHLAGFKVPRTVRFVDSLPRNPSGKVMKNILREEKSS
ncbi:MULTISPECIES: 3-[(3aS,4S,7aS)-7a-methyl-1,5-dioxo-octahydro-1H-inden-4-yl]propanoyl:CoA ligase [Rhodococcus]|uniref:FadD3 family acyl-CoA ligase n=1 Tax=Rhodococcus oxybenzonivorans TaxID=1990687 RepID=A0AAE4V0B5_9NOCA|nr:MULTISPECIES: 3-[(3aS,4S,7aS)-7a-methyl-1,5-dioxo-octahydro-1H-inden-4-yl]propanoyl:CoA ligase [Rhodococcus]MDV7241203.1 FadD3 family acyl-CoA ligase [Rhodococcus oxybenzonivorans]MDV7265681.1 FadD3 family acyl-CoA ligase [Rhodococcus oxybenzonivorans]MDV7273476.1 FadD3 family acyl-CoA ligase [Rhodococcus oxybenzonivorans]MDV7332786.1 FadD3 family acyl-CoA ligase [Rhodococcus oxybenzonivorans]MDV7341952.1 FadD3 family acyl-CoA ligase [Rhodococcus oxybenzonivorans]